jgi:hypothetical protein
MPEDHCFDGAIQNTTNKGPRHGRLTQVLADLAVSTRTNRFASPGGRHQPAAPVTTGPCISHRLETPTELIRKL